jgi:hypothetical protein
MNRIRTLIDDGLCPFLPMWRMLLILEFTFLSLLGISTILSSGPPSIAVYLSLLFILPTVGAILGLVYYCSRQ